MDALGHKVATTAMRSRDRGSYAPVRLAAAERAMRSVDALARCLLLLETALEPQRPAA